MRRGVTSAPTDVLGQPARAAIEVLDAAQLMALVGLARTLGRVLDHADIAAIAVEEARSLTGTVRASVWELAGDAELRLVVESTRAVPRPAGTVVMARSAPEWEAARTLRPVWLGSRDVARARYPGAWLSSCDASRCEAWAYVPSIADPEDGRVLALAFPGPRRFDARERAFVRAIAATAATALARGRAFSAHRTRADAAERARGATELRARRAERLAAERTQLYERERFARARAEAQRGWAQVAAGELERAQGLLAALAAATGDAVCEVLVAEATAAFGALGVAVTRLREVSELEVAHSTGLLGECAPPGSRLRVEGSPEGEVLRCGLPVWIRASDAAAGRYGGPTARPLQLDVAWLGVPIASESGADGVVSFAFAGSPPILAGARDRLTHLAVQCAAAVERGGRCCSAASGEARGSAG